MNTEIYDRISNGEAAHFEQERGLIAVWGKESIEFLNGMITNDVAKLEDGAEMLAAFPNAQGRLIAIVRVRRDGDRFLFETEAATREKVFQNLYRFTFAGDFFVEDLSGQFDYFSTFNSQLSNSGLKFTTGRMDGVFLTKGEVPENSVAIDAETFDTLRIERGVPLYGIDCDDTTIVPELGLDGQISYTKGCYIGQEIIARIYFRGHVAKRLTGIVLSRSTEPGTELKSEDGKSAGRVASSTFSPRLGSYIALAFVRWDFLADGTKLLASEHTAEVRSLPFATGS